VNVSVGEPQPDSDAVRTDGQIALERAKGEVSDVLLNIEHALDRAKRARKNVAKTVSTATRRWLWLRRRVIWNTCANGCSRTRTSRATTCA
jgi:hypothetical protein